MLVGDQVAGLSNARHPVAESAFSLTIYNFLQSLRNKHKLRGKNPGPLKDAKS